MKKINLFISIILLIGFAGCHKDNIPSYDLSTFSILWKETSAWADFYYCATIDQDGNLSVREKHGLSNQNRESEFGISEEDMSLVKEKLGALVSIDISDGYGFNNNGATDVPTTKMKYTTKSNSDSTCLYYPTEHELPKELEVFLSVVNQIILKTDTLRN
jgi:hypothetical protein